MSSPKAINFYNNGTNSFSIDVSGNVGIGTSSLISKLTINPQVNDRSSYNHSLAPLTITNQTPTSATVLNDSLPVLNLCRQGTGSVSYGARATLCLSRYENSGVWSRTRLDFKLATDTYNDTNVLTLKSDGSLTIAGPIINSYWRLTNESDYCRLYNNAGSAYFKFAASDLWAQYTLSVGTTATVGSNLTVGATIAGATIVSTGGVDFGQNYYVGTSFRSRMPSYFENDVNVSGYFCCKMLSVANSGTDYVGVQINSSQGSNYTAFLYIMYGSFTGFHRCFIDDNFLI